LKDISGFLARDPFIGFRERVFRYMTGRDGSTFDLLYHIGPVQLLKYGKRDLSEKHLVLEPFPFHVPYLLGQDELNRFINIKEF